MKKSILYILQIFIALLAPIILYVLIGIILSVISTNPVKTVCEEKNEIFITTNGIHLEILFPREFLEDEVLQELQLPEQVKYISFGWGDKKFYLETPTWDQLKFSVAVNAIFFKSESAMHVTNYYNKQPIWESIKLCQEQKDRLIWYVMQSFKKDEHGKLMEIKDSGYTINDKFYEATGNYTLINTCNNWVNIGLKKSDIKTSLWSPFDYGVLYQIKKNQ